LFAKAFEEHARKYLKLLVRQSKHQALKKRFKKKNVIRQMRCKTWTIQSLSFNKGQISINVLCTPVMDAHSCFP